MIDITVEQAAEILEILYSSQDPIVIAGVTTTAGDLAYSERASDRARHVLCEFYGRRRNGRHGMVAGSMADMVLDRMGAKTDVVPVKRRRCAV